MKRPSSLPLYSELWVTDRKSSFCDFGHLPYRRPRTDMHNVRPTPPSVYSSIQICTRLPRLMHPLHPIGFDPSGVIGPVELLLDTSHSVDRDPIVSGNTNLYTYSRGP